MSEIEPIEEKWNDLNEKLKTCSEEEAKELLEREVATKKRPYIIMRIHNRYNRIRADRELKEYLSNASRD